MTSHLESDPENVMLSQDCVDMSRHLSDSVCTVCFGLICGTGFVSLSSFALELR